MLKLLFAIAALLLSVGLAMLGSGLFASFIGLRASLEQLPRPLIGLLMSGYFGGLVIGALHLAPLVNRIGHIRAFAVFCGLASAAVLAFPFVPHPAPWVLLRVVMGVCMAGLFMVTESWLNTSATPANRGAMLSLYMMTSYLALGGSQFLLNIADLQGLDLFLLTAMLMSLALIPVGLTRLAQPAPIGEARPFGLRRLLAISPLAVVGCIAAGMTGGAFYGLGPAFAQELGLPVSGVARFMGLAIIAGLLLQVPVGRLSDRMDRRLIILGSSLALAAASVLVAAAASLKPATVALVAMLYGGFAATLYPLCVAFANDHLEASDMVPASGGLLLAYGVGATLGPGLAGGVMRMIGTMGLFVFTAAVALLLAIFVLARRQAQPVPVTDHKESFVALPDAVTATTGGGLDPRAELIGDEQGAEGTPVAETAAPAQSGRERVRRRVDNPFPETEEMLRRTRERW